MTSCCPEGAPDTRSPYEGYHWHDKGVVDQVGACTGQCTVYSRASNELPRSFTIMEKAPTRTLLRHYAKWVLTPRSLNVKLGPRRNYHKGRAAIRHYANQTARPL